MVFIRSSLIIRGLLVLLPAVVQGAISSTAELNQFFKGSRPDTADFVISGSVTHVVANDPVGNFILQDKTGKANLDMRWTTPLKAGDLVIAQGSARLTVQLEPCLWNVSCKVVGHGPAPTNAVVSLAEIDSPRYDLMDVETEGIVADAFADDLDANYDFLIVKDGRHTLPVACLRNPSHKKLIDARIRIRGLFRHQISSERKFVGPNILADGEDAITVLVPPPSNPFDFPALEQSNYISPQDIQRMDKRSASGTVVATWAQQQLLLRTPTRDICVRLSETERLPPCGSRVTAVGYPETDLLRYHLMRARVRIDGEPVDFQPSPSDAEAQELFRNTIGQGLLVNRIFGKVVTLRGIVRLLPTHETEELKLTLDIGQAKVPVDFSSNPTADEGLTVGSEIEVTGCVILETALWQPSNVFPRIERYSLVIRRPSDIRILAGPPWWTPGRLAVVIALLLVALVAFWIRNLILARLGALKLAERTQLAVELHDSLSQTLAGLACQIAASQDALHASPRDAEAQLRTADQMLKSCRTELRQCLFDLRNDTIAEKDLQKAVERTLKPLSGDAEITVRFNVRRTLFDDATVHAILTIVRELTANAIHHGHAWTVRVAGAYDKGELRFSVRDDGIGFDVTNHPGAAEGHFGLAGIRERLKRLRGSLELDSRPGHGTKAVVRLSAGPR